MQPSGIDRERSLNPPDRTSSPSIHRPGSAEETGRIAKTLQVLDERLQGTLPPPRVDPARPRSRRLSRSSARLIKAAIRPRKKNKEVKQSGLKKRRRTADR